MGAQGVGGSGLRLNHFLAAAMATTAAAQASLLVGDRHIQKEQSCTTYRETVAASLTEFATTESVSAPPWKVSAGHFIHER